MKEAYFTAENIQEVAEEFLNELKGFRKRHRQDIDKHHIALLILDMQRFFLDENSPGFLPSAPAILPEVISLMNRFIRKGLPVIITRHENAQENAGALKRWWKELILKGSPMSEIVEELNIHGTKIIEKSQYDAFYQTELEEVLQIKGIKQVVITGVKTHLCCETTARSAFVRGFDVFFTVDGTATDNRKFHMASLLNLSHGFAIPVLCREIFL